MKIYGTIINRDFVASPEQDRLEKHYFASLKNGTLITKEYKKFRQSKTWKQVKVIWGLAMTTIAQHFEDNGWDTSKLLRIDHETGNKCSPEQIYEYLCEVCPIYEDGQRITLSKMSIEQAGEFYNACRNFAASNWFVEIPKADINWKNKKKNISRGINGN